MNLNLTSRVVRTNGAITAAVDEELVMMDVQAGTYYGLNPVGAAIWKLLEHPITVHDLCLNLTKSYEVSFDRCSTEVLTFLERLQSKGLMHVAP